MQYIIKKSLPNWPIVVNVCTEVYKNWTFVLYKIIYVTSTFLYVYYKAKISRDSQTDVISMVARTWFMNLVFIANFYLQYKVKAYL